MYKSPMIEIEWDDSDGLEQAIISKNITKPFDKKIHSPREVLALALLENAYQAEIDGQIDPGSFYSVKNYVSNFSELPSNILCIELTKILLNRGRLFRNFNGEIPVDDMEASHESS
jgi:hypothetical protein